MSNKKIITLSNFLRNEGMNISIRSTITASWFWENFYERSSYTEMKKALEVIYVKNKEDCSKFNQVYDKLFDEHIIEEEINSQKIDKKIENIPTNNTNTTNTYKNQEDNLNKELIETRKEGKIINDKLTQNSIVMLDPYDKRVFDICQRLSKKIANQRSKRRKLQKSNKINMPQTIRFNLKNGGHLVKLFHQKPPLKKTKQIFLCDVSGSCEWSSTWFFAIMYGCYKTFDKVTLYDFDNILTDVTDTLGSHFESTSQINFTHRNFGVKAFGQSDMANVFKQVIKEVQLNNHTDIIILSDCRDWRGNREEGILESAKILHQIVIKSRKVIILNPEKKIRWNTPTSCVKDYQQAGAKIYETCTLNQFANVISRL
ncbi:VWA domain-containing protein [Methanosphaera sp.]